jgi:hypothetical protein
MDPSLNRLKTQIFDWYISHAILPLEQTEYMFQGADTFHVTNDAS